MIFGFLRGGLSKTRVDFDILNREKGKVVYLDNACMSLKPKQVLDKMMEYYTEYPACAGRSVHKLSKKVEDEVLEAREEVRKFIDASSREEIIFTRNTTEGINLIANTLGLKQGDEVVISDKEHNSNLIPWLKLQKERGVRVVVCSGNPDGTFNMESFKRTLNEKTKLVSIVHISNLDGVENPIKEIIKLAHENKSLVMIDGAQSVPHKKMSVKKLGMDFLVFSGHKMLAPTGTGVLYGRKELLEKMDQFLVGGETVINSTYSSYVPENLPNKFEAGLQDYAGIIGLGAACKYLRKLGLNRVEEHEMKLNSLLTDLLKGEEKIRILGPQEASKRGGIYSFNIRGIDPHHVARILSTSKNIMLRSGAHCVHSWFNKHGMKGSVRASMYFYNTEDEIKLLAEEIRKIAKLG